MWNGSGMTYADNERGPISHLLVGAHHRQGSFLQQPGSSSRLGPLLDVIPSFSLLKNYFSKWKTNGCDVDVIVR